MKYPALVLLALALPGAAMATDYNVQINKSTLGFSDSFQGASFSGHFTRWQATIRYDPRQLESSRFDVTVQTASAVTGDSDKDNALPGAELFATAKFPTAHYAATGFHRDGGKVIADGKLTLRGVTRPLSLDVVFKPDANGATLDVSGTIKRLDFGVGTGDYADTSVIGAQVKVTAHLQLTPR